MKQVRLSEAHAFKPCSTQAPVRSNKSESCVQVQVPPMHEGCMEVFRTQAQELDRSASHMDCDLEVIPKLTFPHL